MSEGQMKISDIIQPQIEKNVPRGALLEYRIQRLFFAMGYYSKTGIVVKTGQDPNSDVITDLDVYGTYIHKNFTSRRIWADCKSGKAKPLERISWLKGVRSTIKIDDVIFVKSGVRTATKQFAHKSGIMVLDEKMISKLEQDFEVDTNDWSGPWNPLLQQNMIKKLREIDKQKNGICARTGNYISSAYWCLDEYARVKKCITAIRQLSEFEQICQSEQNKKIVKWAVLQLIPMFTLATLNICRDLYFLSDAEKKDIVWNSLISSEIPVNKRTEIVNATYRIAVGIFQQQYPAVQIPQLDSSIGLVPPSYFDKYYDLILRITGNPNHFFDVLRFLDYSLQEYALNDSTMDISIMKKRIPNFESARIGFKTLLYFIRDTCAVPTHFFDSVLKI